MIEANRHEHSTHRSEATVWCHFHELEIKRKLDVWVQHDLSVKIFFYRIDANKSQQNRSISETYTNLNRETDIVEGRRSSSNGNKANTNGKQYVVSARIGELGLIEGSNHLWTKYTPEAKKARMSRFCAFTL